MSITILESDKEIQNRIAKAVAEEMNEVFARAKPKIEAEIKGYTWLRMRDSNTYRQLMDGRYLAGHFGFPRGEAKNYVDPIIEAVINGLIVNPKKFVVSNGKLKGGLEILLLKDDMSEATNANKNKPLTTDKGQILPWTEWLLLRGNDRIISEYQITWFPGAGRSKQAFMKKNEISFWKVPDKHQGTRYKNWFTEEVIDSRFEQDTISIIFSNIQSAI